MRLSLVLIAVMMLAVAAANAAYAVNDTLAVEPYTFSEADFQAQPWTSPLTPMFDAAAAHYNVPLPLLLALAYFGSAFENRGVAPTIEGGYGVMALRKNKIGADSLGLGSRLIGASEGTLKTDPAANISSCAAVLDNYAKMWQVDRSQGLAAWLQPVITFAGLNPENSRFFAYEVFKKLKTGLEIINSGGETFTFAPQDIGSVDLGTLLPRSASVQSPDYPAASWSPAAECNYDASPHISDTVVLHTMEGTLAGTISMFQSCPEWVSSNYCMGEDGTVVQMVRETQTSWHGLCYNYRSIGIEQEGYAASATHPKALYDATSALVRDICNRNGIPKQHNVVGPGVVGHIDITNNACGSHWDPGMGWDWSYCMQQICSASPTDQVYVEPRGQNSSYYSDDGSSYWGNSTAFCNSFDSHLTSSGSRVFPTSNASASGRWIQVRPILAIPGGTYQVEVAHAGPTNVSTDLKVRLSITNASRISANNTWTYDAYKSANSCMWVPIAQIKLAVGETQPTVKLTYYSGTASNATHQWSVEAFRFTSVATASNLTLTACPSGGGTVAGAGMKNAGDQVTVTATPTVGYTFVSWTTGGCGGTVVSTSASYTFNIPGQNYALYANFAATGPVLTAMACTGGTASGGGVYSAGTQVTATAAASQGYTFSNWTLDACGGALLSSIPSYTFSMPAGDYTVCANFTPGSYNLTTTPCGSGTVSGGGVYMTGDSVTVTATPAPGYCLYTWTTDGCGGSNVVSKDTSYTFAMPGANYTLNANFAKGLLYEDFENYNMGGNSPDSLDKNDPQGANGASNGSGNAWWGQAAPNARLTGPIDGVNPHHGNRMVHATMLLAMDCYNVAYRCNGGSVITGGVYMDWWFYDPVGSSGNSTTFCNDFSGLGYYTNVPATTDYPTSGVPGDETPYASQQLAVGMSSDWNTGYDAAKYQIRVMGDASGYHSGWSNTSVTRSIGWHHARVVVGPRKSPSNTNDVGFYIDDMAAAQFTKDSTTTLGYNLMVMNLCTPKGYVISTIRSSENDEITFGKLPNAPGSASASSSGSNQITWTWTDTSDDEDGFHIWDSLGNLKGTVSASSSSWTESGLAANTSYTRSVSAYINVSGSALDTARVTLPATYTLAATPVAKISDLWPFDNSVELSLSNKTVTASAPGAFWIEEADRTAAVKVIYASPAAKNHLVNVYGMLDSSGTQRALIAGHIDDLGITSPIPAVGMIERILGGSNFNTSTPGISGGIGRYSIGMLVRVAGKVTYANSSDPQNKYLYVDDGSGLSDGSGHPGVKILCGSIDPPTTGSAIVCGVIDTAKPGANVVPVLVVRDSADIRAL